MIHEVSEAMFSLPLQNYVLTFDDGLYSQYHYAKRFAEYNTPMIFFISSGIVCNGQQSNNFLGCMDAHKKAFEGNYEDYMTLEQIKELAAMPNVTIGAHGHNHLALDAMPSLVEKVRYLNNDIKLMLEWFKTNLGVPTVFCYPHNNDLDGIYKGLLTKVGFTDFHGSERIPIETLLQS
jgi:peptidoglycan/xylan/chitin deacetylase (PgdA/CDA1 family)